jgi:6-phosphofructokinase 1
MKKIAVMTGGGDCPGLNAVIRAVERSGLTHGFETFGIHNGWQGLIEGELEPLTDISVSGISTLGGTILGTSRIDPLNKPGDVEKIENTIQSYGIDALVAIGGNGTLSAAHELSERGIPLVGVPKTIDNDISGTDQLVLIPQFP